MSLLTSLVSPRPTPSVPKLRSGKLYSHPAQNSQGTVALSANVLYAVPLIIPEPTLLVKIGLETTIAAVGGSLARLGIYDGSTGEPGALWLDAGTVAVDAIAVTELTIALMLPPGYYFAAGVSNGAPTIRHSTLAQRMGLFGNTSTFSTPTTHFTRSFTYGLLPATFGAVTDVNSTNVPFLYVKAA